MDRSRTWQFALALALPLLVGAAIFFSTNQTVEIVSGQIAGAIPLWAAAAVGLAVVMALIGGEIDRAREVRRLNKEIADERIASGPEADRMAHALVTGNSADVALIERRLAIDLGLDGIATVAFHERKNGKIVNVNSRRKIGFVHVAAPEDASTVAKICAAIDAAYASVIPGVEAHILDNDRNDLHGNSKIKNLRSSKL
ncbi:MAG: hypothetical protein GC190_02645 [Alphaproteobacteria bacterium]|nr:hypothetical protein [Alphaproteobacteria bacterium]